MNVRTLVALNIAGVAALVGGLVLGSRADVAPTPWVATIAMNSVQAEHYDSISGMTRSADAVVLGRVASVKPGRVFGKVDPEYTDPEAGLSKYANVKIQVDELIRGELRGGWTLEVPIGDHSSVDEVHQYLSLDHQALFFLRHKAAEAEAMDLGAGVVKENMGYYRLVTGQAVLIDDHGKAVAPLPGEDAFANVSGSNFDSVVAQIRAIN